MTVTVTRKPGGITQLFNTETGRVTYKCKAESAYLLIEAFGGIVQFHQKGAMATVALFPDFRILSNSNLMNKIK